MDFADGDDMLKEHLSRELMNGATMITEDLQKDLLASAGGSVFWCCHHSTVLSQEKLPPAAGITPELQLRS
jgi:hypothetical protein